MPRAMVVVAHADDETIALGARMGRFQEAHFVHVTDGAPRNEQDSRAHGFAALADYRQARDHELREMFSRAADREQQAAGRTPVRGSAHAEAKKAILRSCQVPAASDPRAGNQFTRLNGSPRGRDTSNRIQIGGIAGIVEDGVTGFLVDDAEGMAEAIQKIKTISPGACDDAARTRFSRLRMIDQYCDLYHTILREGPRRSASIG